MTFSPAILASRFAQFEAEAGSPARFVIAFSGGLDSTALAHALAQIHRQDSPFADVPVLAIHIDHGLHPESATWSDQCAQMAAALEIDFQSLIVNVLGSKTCGAEALVDDASDLESDEVGAKPTGST